MTKQIIDVTLSDAGSFILASPRTQAGLAWVKNNISDNGYQPLEFPLCVIIESRYMADILDGMENDGLIVRMYR